MKLVKFFALTLVISVFCEAEGRAQEPPPPPDQSVVRLTNCTIDDGFTFADLVERARDLPRNATSPDNVFFRRPVYVSAEYQERWDVQVALFYPSFTEMINRRVAAANSVRGRLPMSCGPAQVLRYFTARQAEGPFANPTAMTTSFCRLTDGSLRGAFNRISTIAGNYGAAGNEALVQMYLPGLGGPLNRESDFVLAIVGTSREELTEGLDLRLNGFRPELGNYSTAGFSCDRPSLWATTGIYSDLTN